MYSVNPFSLLIFSALLLVSSKGDFPNGAISAVRCLLVHNAPADCASLPRIRIPNPLVMAFTNSPEALQEALGSKHLRDLPNIQVATLPLVLLYLIPQGRLAELSGAQLGAVLQTHADDPSLAAQISASLRNTNHLLQLLNKLQITTLSKEVQQVIGESLRSPDLNETSQALVFLREPIMSYIRPTLLLELDDHMFYLMALQLQSLKLADLPKKSTIRVIGHLAIEHNYPLNTTEWLVMGLTPDEIRNMSLTLDLSSKDFKLDLNTLQVRAIFDRVYANVVLEHVDFIDSKPLLSRLTPRQLQRFHGYVHKHDSIKLPPPSSLATASQIMEHLKMDCVLTGKLPEDEYSWENRIHYLGPWVYTLPFHIFDSYLHKPLNVVSLYHTQSSYLSPMQAYYLAGKGELLNITLPNSVLALQSALLALPASQLTTTYIGDVSSDILEHLYRHLPAAGNMPRTLSFMHKFANDIGESFTLSQLLHNKDLNTFMGRVSAKTLQASAASMLRVIASDDNYGPPVQRLPEPVLAALLDQAQLEDSWSWLTVLDRLHVNRHLVRGLNCRHVSDLEPGLFIPIMAYYNRLRVMQHQPFSKNLQKCCLQKLLDHLKTKMSLSQLDERFGLISTLEPIEIESVGGYVLTGLPTEAMKASSYTGSILSSVGKLTIAELLLAANISHLQEIAKLAVDKEGKVDVFLAGNLVWFLPTNISLSHLRLMLETKRLDTTICMASEERRAVANWLIDVFGPSESWSAGVLATLQDLLIVFSDEELWHVSKLSWTEAADTFNSHYGDQIEWIQPKPFYQACMDILGEKEEKEYQRSLARLIRWRLKAAQWQLDTVTQVSLPNSGKQTVNYIPVPNLFPEQVTDVPETVWQPPVAPAEREEEEGEEEEEEEEYNEIDITDNEYEDYSGENEDSPEIEFINTTERTVPQWLSTAAPEKTISSTEHIVPNLSSTAASESTNTTTEGTVPEWLSTAVPESTNTTTEVTVPKWSSTAVPESTNTTIKLTVPKWSSTADPESTNTTTKQTIQNWPSTEPPTSTFPTTLLTIHNRSSPTVPRSIFPTTQKTINNWSDTIAPTITFPTTQQSIHSLSSTEAPTMNHNSVNETEQNYEFENFDNNANDSKDQSHNLQKLINEPPIIDKTTNIYENDQSRVEKEDLQVNKKISTLVIPQSVAHESFPVRTSDQLPFHVIRNRSIPQSSKENSRLKRGANVWEHTNFELTCKALRMVGRLAGLGLAQRDIDNMLTSELDDCRSELGAMDLPYSMIERIWKRMETRYGLHLFGNLLQNIAVADIWELDLNSNAPWALESVHAIVKHNDKPLIMSKLLTRVNEQNQHYSPDLLTAMGGIICTLEPELDQLGPAFSVVGLEAWPQCPACLPRLAQAALQELGPAHSWTQHHMHLLHSIVAGLPLEDWKALVTSPFKPLYALHPYAIKCLNDTHLQMLSDEHIQMIPTVTLLNLPENRRAALNATQLQALNDAALSPEFGKLMPEPVDETFEDISKGSGNNIGLQTIVLMLGVNFIFTLRFV